MSNLAYDTRTPCEQDSELFHAPDRELPSDKATREAAAKALCATCPLAVREDCLRIAMDNERGLSAGNRNGLYAGLTEQERAALDNHNDDCGTVTGYNRHRKAKKPACADCKAAWRDYFRDRRKAS